MKLLITLFAAFFIWGCSSTTNNQTQTNTDSVALEAIDSSAIINDSTVLPRDSITTTVAH